MLPDIVMIGFVESIVGERQTHRRSGSSHQERGA